MIWQVMIDLDTREAANATQPEIFGHPTTDFYAMQQVPRTREMTLTEQASPSIQTPREKTSGEILDEVFRDYADAWRRLAQL